MTGALRRLRDRLGGTGRREETVGWFAYAPMSGATYDARTAAAAARASQEFAQSLPDPELGLPASARALVVAAVTAAPAGHPGRETLLAQVEAASAAREPHWETGVIPDVVPHLPLFLPGMDAQDGPVGVERVVPHQQTWPVHGRTRIGGITTHVDLHIMDGLLADLVLRPYEPEDDPEGYDEALHTRFEALVRELSAWPDPAEVTWELEGTSGRRQ